MGILKRRWIWLKRFRHRRGYGVHSPFAFNFITNVVYEQGEYYAYAMLRDRHRSMARYWGGHSMKCRKFLFRLANYVHPSVITMYGDVNDVWRDYITAGCRTAQVCYGRKNNKGNDNEEQKELAVINRDVLPKQWQETVRSIQGKDSACIIVGIHDSSLAQQEWCKIMEETIVAVTFDLYDFGIIFFDTSKQKQHYIVNFN